jgi:hypothetical protein
VDLTEGKINNAICAKNFMLYVRRKITPTEQLPNVCLFVCLFSWRYNPLWFYFHSPVAGFSLLVFEVS